MAKKMFLIAELPTGLKITLKDAIKLLAGRSVKVKIKYSLKWIKAK